MLMTIGVGSLLLVVFIVIIVYMLDKAAVKQADANIPRLRACPMCGKELKIGENIVAERAGMARPGVEKIVIKGCGYCLGRM